MLAGTVVVALCLLAGVTAAALAVYAGFNREEPGSEAFTALMVGSSLWAFTYALALVSFDPGLREALELPMELAKAIVAPAWLVFALRYTGYDEYVTRRTVAVLVVVPATTVVLMVLDPTGILWTHYQIVPTLGLATVHYDPLAWYYFHAIYAFALIGAGIAVILNMLVAQGPLYREQAIALVVGSVSPTLTFLKRILRLPPAPQLDLTPIALGVMGLSFGYALFRFDLFGLVPATRRLGRRTIIDDIEDAVLVVDTERRVIDANVAAEQLFNPDGTLVGAPLASIVEHDELAIERTPYTLPLDTDAGWRTFEVRVSQIRDQHGRHVASAVTLHDVTERENRRQRLEVLNRVLRHNLRNDMTVILGNAELISEQTEGAPAQAAERIAERASELSVMSERAREIEEIMEAREGAAASFDAVPVLERVVAKITAQYPNASSTVETPSELPLHVRTRVFEAAVENLVDNALEHNDADEPWVGVRLTHTAGPVRLEVVDNGPGVPRSELAVLEEGAETPLEHGSGMGLWLITWCIQSLGGRVEFESREPRGTRVAVTLPAALVADEPGERAD